MFSPRLTVAALLVGSWTVLTNAFVVVVRPTARPTTTTPLLPLAMSSSPEQESNTQQTNTNSRLSQLPEIPGDYDWDSKYQQDSDWITTNVPGKIVLNELQLAQQATVLGKLEEDWRNRRANELDQADIKVGFVARAEMLNGRTAMFFLVTGLLTEYWTGISLPGQVEEMLRVSGVIGFE